MEKFADAVYDTMCGHMLPEYMVPGVENLFEDGKECMNNYSEMLNAFLRLCERLNVGELEDMDCEIMVDSLLDNQYRVGMTMFLQGYEFGQKGCPPYRYMDE